MSDDVARDAYVTQQSWLQPGGRPDAIDEIADQFERPAASVALAAVPDTVPAVANTIPAVGEAIPAVADTAGRWPSRSGGWRSAERLHPDEAERRVS